MPSAPKSRSCAGTRGSVDAIGVRSWANCGEQAVAGGYAGRMATILGAIIVSGRACRFWA